MPRTSNLLLLRGPELSQLLESLTALVVPLVELLLVPTASSSPVSRWIVTSSWSMIFQLIYRSRVARKVRFADAEAIAAAAAKNNAKASISGLLLYTPMYFLQVLEGERSVVEATYARITKDDRHEEVVTLAQSEVPERQFGKWAMRAVTPSREMSAAVVGQLTGDAARELLLSSR